MPSRGSASPPRFRTRVIVAAAIALYLVIEGFSLAELRLLERRGVRFDPRPSVLTENQKDTLSQFLSRGHATGMGFDPVLGWTKALTPTIESIRQIAETNSAGMRDDQEYAPFPAAGITRIEAFGDSFTYCRDVRLAECWAKRIPEMAPRVEVLNYGVGAYGLDQAYLRYLKVGATYHPHIVFIGYMTENFQRDVNVFRAFYSDAYPDWIFSKPRFQLQSGRLALLKNPLSSFEDYQRLVQNPAQVLAELGRNDFHYQMSYGQGPLDSLPSVRLAKIAWATAKKQVLYPLLDREGVYNPNSEAYQVTEKIFDAFYRKVLEDGALPIIVIFPNTTDQQRNRDRKPRCYAPLLKHFNAEQYRFVDLLNAFQPYQSRYQLQDLLGLSSS
ncbi:MAG: SGNH/GDSL hydrolase family protein [Acidobacteriia bacterium]|nr:SGNH/GDSL hydrolase family protein [Terriglobia bacterium]